MQPLPPWSLWRDWWVRERGAVASKAKKAHGHLEKWLHSPHLAHFLKLFQCILCHPSLLTLMLPAVPKARATPTSCNSHVSVQRLLRCMWGVYTLWISTPSIRSWIAHLTLIPCSLFHFCPNLPSYGLYSQLLVLLLQGMHTALSSSVINVLIYQLLSIPTVCKPLVHQMETRSHHTQYPRSHSSKPPHDPHT